MASALPAVEVMLNTSLIADLIEKGRLLGVREAMEKSWQKARNVRADIARLIVSGVVDAQRRHGLCRLAHQPDVAAAKRLHGKAASPSKPPEPEEDEGPSFTEITLNSDD
jgi:twitching motility protein PilU